MLLAKGTAPCSAPGSQGPAGAKTARHLQIGAAMLRPKQMLSLLKDTFKSWADDYAPSMGAALAYYTMFSIAPLLLIVIAVAGFVFGPEAARGEILSQLQGLMGNDGAHAVEGLLKSMSQPERSTGAAITGIVVLL